MATPENARMVIWFELDGPDVVREHDHWHAQEHMFERLEIPGFIRGRRAISLAGPRKYFITYEVEALATLDSEPYRRCLNNPTPWTLRMMPHLRNVTRSLCRVAASSGGGVGSSIATVRFSPAPGAEAELQAWLGEEVIPPAAAARGLTAAQLLVSAGQARRQQTREQGLRGSNDGEADWVLIVEGYDHSAVQGFLAGPAAAASLERRGAAPGALHDAFALDFALAAHDVRS